MILQTCRTRLAAQRLWKNPRIKRRTDTGQPNRKTAHNECKFEYDWSSCGCFSLAAYPKIDLQLTQLFVPLIESTSADWYNSLSFIPLQTNHMQCRNTDARRSTGMHGSCTKALAIDVCCIQETRFQDISSLIRLISESNIFVFVHLCIQVDPKAVACDFTGVHVALTEKA